MASFEAPIKNRLPARGGPLNQAILKDKARNGRPTRVAFLLLRLNAGAARPMKMP